MTIKAVLRHAGVIQPVEPFPSDWAEGQELLVEEPKTTQPNAEISQWRRKWTRPPPRVPAEEHERFLTALEEIERESKDTIRKQWGI